jgi:glycosyltransferase involved in cell wall biosynthesis
VAPSLWPEPFGLVGLEAGLQAIPAAAFAVGGIPDWLIPGITGELAPGDPPTIEGLSCAIVRALRNREHYERLSLGAWKIARQFTVDRHLDVLEPILANRPSSRVAVRSI